MSFTPIPFLAARAPARPSARDARQGLCGRLGLSLLALSLLGLSACSVTPVQAPLAVPAHPAADKPVQPPVHEAAASALAPVATPSGPGPVQSGQSVPAPATVAPASPRLEPVRATSGDQVRPLAVGLASWYGKPFHGRRTANGERFDMNGLTAAHRSLPFGTQLRVRSVSTGREVVVRINDRGPVPRTRIIDLSLGAARALGVEHLGVTRVELLRE